MNSEALVSVVELVWNLLDGCFMSGNGIQYDPNDSGMFGGNVCGFVGIFPEIEKKRRIMAHGWNRAIAVMSG